jgi:hypothetical protein
LDIYMQSALHDMSRAGCLGEPSETEVARSPAVSGSEIVEASPIGLEQPLDSSAKKPKQNTNSGASQGSKKAKHDQGLLPTNDRLQQVVSHGAKRKVAAYESLQQAGFIRPATEFLDGSMIK